MKKDLNTMSENELIMAIENNDNNEKKENIFKEKLIEVLLDNSTKNNFLKNFDYFSKNHQRLGYKENDFYKYDLPTWLKKGHDIGVDTNLIMAKSISNKFFLKTVQHLLNNIPDREKDEYSEFGRKDIILIGSHILNSLDSAKNKTDNLLYLKDHIIINNNNLYNEFEENIKKELKNKIEIYPYIINSKVNYFNIKFDDIPFNNVIKDIETTFDNNNSNDVSNYSIMLNKIGHFIDAGIFDKDITKANNKLLDLSLNGNDILNDTSYTTINPVLNIFKDKNIRSEFLDLLCVRDFEIFLDGPEKKNKVKYKM